MASPVLRMSMSGALCVRKRPIALTRRSGIPPCGIADCAPVQCCVRPVLAPAQAFVRAGERRGNAEFGMRTRRGRLIRAVRMFCARRVCFYGSAGVVALDVRQSLRFCSGRLRLASGRICGSVGRRLVCVRICGSAGVVALDVRQSLRFCSGRLRLMCVRSCGSAGAVVCAWRAFASAALSRPLPRFTPVFFPLSGKKRRLAVSCVPVPPGRDRHSRVLVVSVRLSALAGSFRVCTFLYGDLDGLPGRGDGVTRGTGSAARPLCAFTLPHWLCCAFRREYVGAARPKPAPKSLRLSGLSSRCGGVALVRVRCAVIRALSET